MKIFYFNFKSVLKEIFKIKLKTIMCAAHSVLFGLSHKSTRTETEIYKKIKTDIIAFCDFQKISKSEIIFDQKWRKVKFPMKIKFLIISTFFSELSR